MTGQPAQVYVLLEHQSYPDRWVPLQLQRYLTRLWEQKHCDTPAALLPPMVAMVLYHGVRRWDHPPGTGPIKKNRCHHGSGQQQPY